MDGQDQDGPEGALRRGTLLTRVVSPAPAPGWKNPRMYNPTADRAKWRGIIQTADPTA
jgi:hypothetical protein